MGHRLDVVVAGDSQQSIISNSSVVNPDMGELGDGGCLEQTGMALADFRARYLVEEPQPRQAPSLAQL